YASTTATDATSRRSADAPGHVLDVRAGNARDQSRPALERQVAPHPVHRHDGTIAETDQIVDVCDAPDEPAQQAGQPEPVYLYNCALAPDRRDRTEVAVAKWRECRRLAACD